MRLLVARPAVRVAPVLLIRRQPVHAVLAQNAMHGRAGDRQAVKPLQVVGNLARAEVIVLAEVEDLADDVGRRRPRRSMRRCVPVGQSGITIRGAVGATCRTSYGKWRNAGRYAPRSRPRRPPGVASGANSSTAVALNSSSGLQSKVFRLRRESGCHLGPVISQSVTYLSGRTGFVGHI